MRKLLPYLVTILLTLPSLALSQTQDSEDWKKVGKGPKGDWYFREVDIKRVSKGIVKVWAKEIPYPESNERYAYSLQLVMFDCVESRIRFLQVVTYDSRKNVLDSYDFVSSRRDIWQDIIPGSIGEALMNFFCD